MAEDDESGLEKSEQASQQRLDKAREDGDIPRSRELATFASLMAATCGFWILGESMLQSLKHVLSKGLTFNHDIVMDTEQITTWLLQPTLDLLLITAPFIGLLMITGLAAPILVGGWLFTTKTIEPNFGKLNPIKGLGNMFSTRSLVELIKAILKTLLVGAIASTAIREYYDDIFALISQPLQAAVVHHGHLLLVCFTIMVSGLAIITLIDVPYQLIHYANKLKMTRQQIKDEMKENMGNPQVKNRIRSLQRAMARRRMMSKVPTADVVVTNPSHYAIALKYREDSDQAPQVIAKGADEVARRIREIAVEHGIEIVEAPPLARALYQFCELDTEIPAELYTAVAKVLAYVFQLRTWQTFGGQEPMLPQELPVPAEMDILKPKVVNIH